MPDRLHPLPAPFHPPSLRSTSARSLLNTQGEDLSGAPVEKPCQPGKSVGAPDRSRVYPPILRRYSARPKKRGWLSTFLLLLGFALALNLHPLSANQPAQESAGRVHTVAAGETLSEIAQAAGLPLDALMAYNGITNANAIRIGQRLRLPPLPTLPPLPPLPDSAQDEATDAPVVAETPAAGGVISRNRTMTVRADDTPARIALRYGVNLAALQALNGLEPTDNSLIQGQRLLLPATADDLRVAAPDTRYRVQPGDSLGLIAQAHGIPLRELMAANRIGNPDTIQPGQALLIPGPIQTGAAPPIGPARAGFLYHNVQPGETLSQLAQRFDTTPQAIVRYNGLPDEGTVYYGLEIRIPYGPPQLSRRLPPAPQTGTEFVVSITRQRCWVMQNGIPRHNWPCSTGQGQWATRTGTFPIKTKLEEAKSSAYRLDMPFWLGLYDVGSYENGIHGLPVDWDSGEKLWDTLVGQPATFGCAMLLDEDAATLFRLSYLGMPVHIVD